jgi:hypothetical protein
MTERFEYDQGNDCDVQLRDCRVEIRSNPESNDTIRINVEIFDKNGRIIAKLQRFIGRR